MHDDNFDDTDWPDFSAEEPEFPFAIDTTRLCPGMSEAALRDLAMRGDARAMYDLGLVAWERAAPCPPAFHHATDLVNEAGQWFNKAASGGISAGEYAIGVIEMTVVGFKSVRDARACFASAANAGFAPAADALKWVDENYRMVTFMVGR